MRNFVTKLRSNLKIVYLIILLLIGVTVAFLIYLLSDQINIPTLNSRYDKVYSEITDSNQELIKLQGEIESTKSMLDGSTSPASDKEIYENLASLYDQSKSELQNRISLNQELKSLNLNSDINKQSDLSIKSDQASVVVLDREINFIKKQLIRVGYQIVAAEVNSCFTQIDYNVENNAVIASINNCLTVLDKQQNYFTDVDLDDLSISASLDKTKQYHTAYQQRWEKSIEVYQALEARDINRSNALKSELDNQIQQLTVLKMQSEQEINETFN